MANKFGKKKGNAKQAWLDWLADDPPVPAAREELRERFKQQANAYRPVNRAQGPGLTPQPPSQTAPQPSVAAPPPPPQPQAVSQTVSTPTAAPGASKSPTPATVSIQISIPSLPTERLRKLGAKLKQGSRGLMRGLAAVRSWFLQQLARHRARTLGLTIAVPVALVLLLLPPLFNFGYGKPKTASGSSSGSSAGASVKYDKPPFQVVVPSNKPKLATPDGVHAAYDGDRNTYTYSDSIGGNGFTVSQQPLPAQFKDGQTAVDTIGPTLNKGATPVNLTVITGQAALSTNPKYNSQAIVAVVRNVLLFMQSSHAFKTTEWQDYIDTLQ